MTFSWTLSIINHLYYDLRFTIQIHKTLWLRLSELIYEIAIFSTIPSLVDLHTAHTTTRTINYAATAIDNTKFIYDF